MIITDLNIHHVRNLSSMRITLNSRFTFIIGPNGSGKTSILEALYLLSCGHSFRTREITPIVSSGQSTLTVFAKAENFETVSIQKSSSSPTQIKLNDQFCSTTSQLAYALPCQIVYSDIFQIIDAGPSCRRSVLDWGLFHVKQEYFSVWKDYKRVLKQRNVLLKKKAGYEQLIPWDKQLSSLADCLDQYRRDYINQVSQRFYEILAQLSEVQCTLSYYKGWGKKEQNSLLYDVLAQHYLSDIQRQYTQYGAHQADLLIESNETKAKQHLSRGQQKIILIALKLAQGILLNKGCLYLFDDLAAELDEHHQQRLLNYLSTHCGQYVVTNIDLDKSKLPQEIINQATIYSIQAGQLVH